MIFRKSTIFQGTSIAVYVFDKMTLAAFIFVDQTFWAMSITDSSLAFQSCDNRATVAALKCKRRVFWKIGIWKLRLQNFALAPRIIHSRRRADKVQWLPRLLQTKIFPNFLYHATLSRVAVCFCTLRPLKMYFMYVWAGLNNSLFHLHASIFLVRLVSLMGY